MFYRSLGIYSWFIHGRWTRKFGPYLLDRSIAGRYSTEDTFYQAILKRHISAFAKNIAYDNKMMQNWRRVTPKLFSSIERITNYRSIIIFSDDGEIKLD